MGAETAHSEAKEAVGGGLRILLCGALRSSRLCVIKCISKRKDAKHAKEFKLN
ncbi:MAG: hypothetical protein IPM50_12020 [Acidobacteriota bacterium]|nr:MAG: hypothetical protein IPM50_12020 [Acidobacteriota bacterium]